MALSKQGYAQLRLGKWDEAKASLQRAIELAKKAPNHAMEIEAGRTLGQWHLYNGEFTEALKTIHSSQKLNAEHPEGWGIREGLANATAETYIVMAEQNMNRPDQRNWLVKAGKACRNALYQNKTDRRVGSESMRLMGTYEWLKGRSTAAQRWWLRSIAQAEKMGQPYDLGMSHLEIGQRLGDRGHLEQAQAIFAGIGAEWDLRRAQQGLEKL